MSSVYWLITNTGKEVSRAMTFVELAENFNHQERMVKRKECTQNSHARIAVSIYYSIQAAEQML